MRESWSPAAGGAAPGPGNLTNPSTSSSRSCAHVGYKRLLPCAKSRGLAAVNPMPKVLSPRLS